MDVSMCTTLRLVWTTSLSYEIKVHICYLAGHDDIDNFTINSWDRWLCMCEGENEREKVLYSIMIEIVRAVQTVI